jgi:hypothetical protein
LFLPWTQNISEKELVTTINNQRPQSIQSVISGRIEKWYVQEGDFVKEILFFLFLRLKKIMDPNLVQNTKNQLDAKVNVEFYSSKYCLPTKSYLYKARKSKN